LNAEGVTCDVLVAGSGAAGFATALTAHLEGLDVIMVEKAPLFGGTTAYSAGVVWIPINSAQRAAGLTDSRQAALDYLAHHVGNRLDRAKAEAFLDNAPAMLDCFAREGFAAFSLVPTWADYHPDEPGALRGGRSLGPQTFDGRRLGSFFPKLRAPIKTMMAFGGMMIGRNDLSRSLKAAAHVGPMVTRYARDRLTHARGTRLVNGNALIARMAAAAIARGIPLWLSSPRVELRQAGGRIGGAVVDKEGKPVELTARLGVV